MAEQYQTIAVGPSVEAVSATRIRDVMEISAVTTPNEINFSFRVPVAQFKSGAYKAKAAGYAANIENILGSDLVDTMYQVQDANQGGNLIDMMEVVVTTPGGEAQALIRHPLATLTFDAISGELIATVNQLYDALNS